MNRKANLRRGAPQLQLAEWGLMDPLINWLIADNPSLLPQSPPVAAGRVGGCVNTAPGAISFIPLSAPLLQSVKHEIGFVA